MAKRFIESFQDRALAQAFVDFYTPTVNCWHAEFKIVKGNRESPWHLYLKGDARGILSYRNGTPWAVQRVNESLLGFIAGWNAKEMED